MPRALIAEDEPLLRAQLKARLVDAWPDLDLIGEAETGEQALALIAELKPDVVFLDIRMPAMSGIDVAQRLGGRCNIVFVTAYDEYAVAAFEEGAVDYVLKPVTAERMAKVVTRVKARLATPPLDLGALLARLAEREIAATPLKWIRASLGSIMQMIAVADVVHPASMGVEPSHAVDGIGILHAFRAHDGFFTVEVVREEHFPRFATAVGHPEWLDDARLLTRSGWSAHIDDVIRPGVEAWAATRSKRDAATELARHGVAAGPVDTAADIRADPHVRARAFVHEFSPLGAEDPDVAVVGSPIAFHPNPPGGAPEGAAEYSGRRTNCNAAPCGQTAPIS